MTVIVYHHHDNSSLGKGEGISIIECEQFRWDEELKKVFTERGDDYLEIPNVYDWICALSNNTHQSYAGYLDRLKSYNESIQTA